MQSCKTINDAKANRYPHPDQSFKEFLDPWAAEEIMKAVAWKKPRSISLTHFPKDLAREAEWRTCSAFASRAA